MPRSILQSSTETDTFAALAGLRVKFWLEPGYGDCAKSCWKELESYFNEEYSICVPTVDKPLILTPEFEYSHMLIMVGQMMGRLRREHQTLFVFFIRHEHGH